MNAMGMINEFFVVPEELIKKRIAEEFDVYEHIQNELVLLHEYQSLPFWRQNISFIPIEFVNAVLDIKDKTFKI